MKAGSLPVLTILPQLRASLATAHVILAAPPGSGKTTAVPPALLAEEWLKKKKILLLEPRRLAARTAARRMSFLCSEAVGETIGYRTRMDSRVSSLTRIEVITEGVLIRKLQSDPELQEVGLVIFDEFHERTLSADLGLALCLDLCQLRPDLRLLVMSATLDSRDLSTVMNDAAVIHASGTQYPVQVHHSHPITDPFSIARITANAVLHIIEEEGGDLLVFLPGVGEIKACQRILTQHNCPCSVLPLYGNLSVRDQDHAITPVKGGKRRIILSTPIAETSLTIEGIAIVVDSGFARRPRFNPATGLNRLQTVRISKASAKQRTGRAGRLAPGICYRLWDKHTEHSQLDFTPPEITLSDLSSLVLELALWGVTDAKQMQWLTSPPPGNWKRAQNLLKSLSAIDVKGKITNTGRRLAELPMHPRLASMLLLAKKQNLLATACILAAILSERDLFANRRDCTDIGERLKLFTTKNRSRQIDHGLHKRIGEQARLWQKKLGCPPGEPVVPEECGQLLIAAFPERIGVLRNGSRDRYLMANGRAALLPPGDLLGGTALLIFPKLDAGKKESRVYLAADITLGDLRNNYPHLLKYREDLCWNDSGSHISMRHNCYLGKAVVKSSPLQNVNEDALLDMFLTGIQKKGPGCLPWSRDAETYRKRVESLNRWGIVNLPDLSMNALFSDLQWLAPYCTKMSRLSQLNQLNIHSILLSLLSWQQQQQVERMAPERLQVASGSRIRLDYRPGQPPVLAVRLQELFGHTETPTVCDGRIPVLLHLLSPAGRPMQVTDDLHSFWKTTYSEIKKELKGRYPKHHWPDDPLLARATSRCKPR